MDPQQTGPYAVDAQATDTKLREVFRRNAPPADETHLAAALRPQRALSTRSTTTRTPKQTPGRRRLRLALMTAGAVVIAAGIGIGSWQAATHLGGDRSVVVITDRPTSTDATGTTVLADLRARLTDGGWEFRADRRSTLEDVHLPSDELSEEDYLPFERGPRLTVTMSDGGSRVSIAGEMGEAIRSFAGTRKSATADRVIYDLDAFAGGRFVVWRQDDGLQAELTLYGSGVPVIASYRGSLEPAPASESFDDLRAASVAAVNALGAVRVSISQTVNVVAVDGDSTLSSGGQGTFKTTAEQWLDPAAGRARLTVHTSEQHVITTTVNGRDQLAIDVDPLSSAKATATRTVRAKVPAGLPLPLWAGDAGQDYTDLLVHGSPSEKRVTDLADGAGTQLSWRQTWDPAIGDLTVTVTLDADLLPTRIDLTGQGGIAGARVERMVVIDYRFERGATFADTDFSMDLPESAFLVGTMYESPLDDPYTERADWGQYWLGPVMGDWSIRTALFETRPTGSAPDDEYITLTYTRAGAGSPTEEIRLLVLPPDAVTAADTRQLCEQQVTLGDWTKREITVAGKPATVFTGAADSADARVDAVCIFLADAFIDIDLWDLADPETVLDAVMPVPSPATAPDTGSGGTGTSGDSSSAGGTGAWAAQATAKGAPDLLALYTTFYEGTALRQANVRVATQYAGDVLLAPGDEYDFDEQLGPRTRARGFQIMLGIVGPGIRPDDFQLGGGITQTATTLFNAALLAGLEISERHNSSIFISHYPAGREAAIAAGSKNLRFVNDTTHDIWIVGTSDGATTTFAIYGTADGRTVHLSTGEFYDVELRTTVTELDQYLSKNKTQIAEAGQEGRTLEVRRTVIMPDGTMIRDDIFKSVWPMYPQKILVGTSTE